MRTLFKNSLLLWIFFIIPSWALMCENGVVEVGDREIEVIKKCSKPTWISKWDEEITTTLVDNSVVHGYKTSAQMQTYHYEEWDYNLGKERFLYFLSFTNGRLTHISEGTWGFDGSVSANDHASCTKGVSIGQRKIEVSRVCGTPYMTKPYRQKRLQVTGTKESSQERVHYIGTDEFSYNFGKDDFLLFISFENGRVVDITYGEYGF